MKALVPLFLLAAIGLSLLGPHLLLADENPDEAEEKSGLVPATVVALLLSANALADEAKNAGRVQPYAKNPRYWQYKGEPLMLLGASKTNRHSLG